MDEREYVLIRGTVEQIVFYNQENGYAVLRLSSDDGAEVTATGTFPNIGLGEEVILTGTWVTHPSYGEQFATEAFERRLPSSVRGIAEYLGSGLIRGIGPRLASRIAEKFGEDTFDVLAYEPERLTAIRGITEKKAREIGRQFTEQNEMRLLMDFLAEHHLPVSLTPLLYKRLRDSAIDALCENPYLLCDPYYDVDFKLAFYFLLLSKIFMKSALCAIQQNSLAQNRYDRCTDIDTGCIAELGHGGDFREFGIRFAAKLVNRTNHTFFSIERHKYLLSLAVSNGFFRLFHANNLVRRAKF